MRVIESDDNNNSSNNFGPNNYKEDNDKVCKAKDGVVESSLEKIWEDEGRDLVWTACKSYVFSINLSFMYWYS